MSQEEKLCPVCSSKYTIDKVVEMALPRVDNQLCNAHLHEVFRKLGGH